MSAGLPVVAYDCIAGPSDMVIDGENGFLIPLFDQSSFKQRLSQLIKDESLRNKEYLLHIFEVMTFGNNSYLLWCDGHNEIVFYPLSERYAAIEYFANAFLKE